MLKHEGTHACNLYTQVKCHVSTPHVSLAFHHICMCWSVPWFVFCACAPFPLIYIKTYMGGTTRGPIAMRTGKSSDKRRCKKGAPRSSPYLLLPSVPCLLVCVMCFNYQKCVAREEYTIGSFATLSDEKREKARGNGKTSTSVFVPPPSPHSSFDCALFLLASLSFRFLRDTA